MAKAKQPDFSLKRLIAWLKRKPANGAYDYCDRTNCLTSQFIKSQGFKRVECGAFTFKVERRAYDSLPAVVNGIAINDPHTYGAALKRAEKALQTFQ